jgi:hypothetical protein
VLKIPEPDRPWFKFGRAFAEEVEKYLRGKLPADDLTPLARAGLEVFPAPMPESTLLVEQEIHFNLAEKQEEDLPFIGYIDLVDLDQKPIEVLDHKTPKSMRWAKSAEQLRVNEQLMLYAHWTLAAYAVPEVVVGHLSFPKESVKQGRPRVVKTVTKVSCEHVAEQIGGIRNDARQMKVLALEKDRVSLIPAHHGDPCYAFGGCPYRNLCPRTNGVAPLPIDADHKTIASTLFGDFEEVRAEKPIAVSSACVKEKKENSMSRLTKLMEGKTSIVADEVEVAEAGILPPDAPPTQAPAPTSIVVDVESLDESVEAMAQEMEDASSADTGAESGVVEEEAAGEPSSQAWGMQLTEIPGLPNRAINRFKEQGWLHESDIINLGYAELKAVPGLGEKTITRTLAVLSQLRKSHAQQAPAPEPVVEAEPPASGIPRIESDLPPLKAEESAFERYRRLRASGSVEAPAPAPSSKSQSVADKSEVPLRARVVLQRKSSEHAPATNPAPAAKAAPEPPTIPPPLEQEAARTTKTASSTKETTILYIGCMPTKGLQTANMVFLEDLLAPFQEEVARAQGKVHYSLVDYGKGPPLVVQQMVLNLDQIRGKHIVVGSSFGKMASAALDLLRPLADVVIQGITG